MTPTGHPLADALLGGGERDAGGRSNSRAALIDAAIEEFAANGYEASTVAAIAQRAGVTTGALYAHFSSKLDVLLAATGLTPIDEIERSAGELATLPRSTAASWLRRALRTAPDERMVLLLDVIVLARRDQRVARALRSGLEAYVAATTRVVEAAAGPSRSGRNLRSAAVEPAEASRLLALMSLGMTVFAALDARPPSAEALTRVGDVVLQSVPARSGDDERGTALSRVRACAAAVEDTEHALRDAIADAVAAGHSLREVGAAAGLSHEGARRIARERG